MCDFIGKAYLTLKYKDLTKDELKNRTKKFHIAVIKVCEQLPKKCGRL